MGSEEQRREVVDGAPGLLPASTTFLGPAHPQQSIYAWEAPAAAQPTSGDTQESVKIEEQGAQPPAAAGGSLPNSVGGGVDEQQYYGGDVSAAAAVIGSSLQLPEMSTMQSPITMSMSTVPPVTPVTMVSSQGMPMVGLDMVQNVHEQHAHQQHLHQLQQHQQQAIVLASGQGIQQAQQQPMLVGPVSLEDLRSAVQQFAVERDWDKFHTPRNLLCALVGEVGELSEIFQWRGEVEPGLAGFSDDEKSHVAQELADILLYLVRLSDICGFDLGQAALNKLQLNAQKYPADMCRGSAAKYTVFNQRQRYETPVQHKLDDESGRKRQRERFTEDQVQAMSQLAERAQWSITAISWEERVKFCEEYNVTKERLSNFFNNRKPKEMKKGRTSRTPLPQMNDPSGQASPMGSGLSNEDNKMQAQMHAMSNQQIHLQALHTMPVQQHLQQIQVLHQHQHQHQPVVDMEHQHQHQHHMDHRMDTMEQHLEHQHVPQADAQQSQQINAPAPA